MQRISTALNIWITILPLNINLLNATITLNCDLVCQLLFFISIDTPPCNQVTVSMCQNGGICINNTKVDSQFSCGCPEEFEGEFCEKHASGCVPNLCQNAGTCQVLL